VSPRSRAAEVRARCPLCKKAPRQCECYPELAAQGRPVNRGGGALVFVRPCGGGFTLSDGSPRLAVSIELGDATDTEGVRSAVAVALAWRDGLATWQGLATSWPDDLAANIERHRHGLSCIGIVAGHPERRVEPDPDRKLPLSYRDLADDLNRGIESALRCYVRDQRLKFEYNGAFLLLAGLTHDAEVLALVDKAVDLLRAGEPPWLPDAGPVSAAMVRAKLRHWKASSASVTP